MAALNDLLDALHLEQLGESRYRAQNVAGGRGVIFGGQLLAQSIVAATQEHPGKEVKTIHTIFARGGSADAPVDIDVEMMHTGRAFASATVTMRQAGRLCTRSLVLMSAAEDDVIRHADPMPAVDPPEHAVAAGDGASAWQVRIVGGVDINDPQAVGPAELDVWTRFDGAPDDLTTSQALLAYATDGFLIGTAMRPHPGVGQSLAHVTLSTGVISHTLTFHEPFAAADWMLLAHRSPYAGRGRTYGRADVFARDGRLVASFVQDNMVRNLPAGQSPAGREKTFL
jgi:acyl-CoA thioesterase